MPSSPGSTSAHGGWQALLERLLLIGLDLLQWRVAASALQTQAEVRRLADGLLALALACVLLATGLLATIGTLLLCLDAGQRPWALGACAALCLASGTWAVCALRRRVLRRVSPSMPA